MNNTIQYKGYVGSVEFSEEDGIFYGKVMGIRSLISYEGESAKELLDDFHGAIDDYLETCKAEGKEPEVAFKGSFNIRLSPDLHKKLFIYTTAHQMSMNKYIEDTLKDSPAARVVVLPSIPPSHTAEWDFLCLSFNASRGTIKQPPRLSPLAPYMLYSCSSSGKPSGSWKKVIFLPV